MPLGDERVVGRVGQVGEVFIANDLPRADHVPVAVVVMVRAKNVEGARHEFEAKPVRAGGERLGQGE